MLNPKDFFKSTLELAAEFRHRIVLIVKNFKKKKKRKENTLSRLRNLNCTKQKVTLTGSTQVVYLGTNFCQALAGEAITDAGVRTCFKQPRGVKNTLKVSK